MEEYKINKMHNGNNYTLIANSASMFRIFKNNKLLESGCCDSFEEATDYVNSYAKTKLKDGKNLKTTNC